MGSGMAELPEIRGSHRHDERPPPPGTAGHRAIDRTARPGSPTGQEAKVPSRLVMGICVPGDRRRPTGPRTIPGGSQSTSTHPRTLNCRATNIALRTCCVRTLTESARFGQQCPGTPSKSPSAMAFGGAAPIRPGLTRCISSSWAPSPTPAGVGTLCKPEPSAWVQASPSLVRHPRRGLTPRPCGVKLAVTVTGGHCADFVVALQGFEGVMVFSARRARTAAGSFDASSPARPVAFTSARADPC